jgi:CheY-like chemotaxis protein
VFVLFICLLLLVLPLSVGLGANVHIAVGTWTVETVGQACAVAGLAGVPATVVTLYGISVLGGAQAAFARWLLAPTGTEVNRQVEELAQSRSRLVDSFEAERRRIGHTVVATVGDGDSMMAAAREHRPDLVVTDVRMPPGFADEGLRAAVTLRAGDPSAAALVLSQYAATAYAAELLGPESRAQTARASGELCVPPSRPSPAPFSWILLVTGLGALVCRTGVTIRAALAAPRTPVSPGRGNAEPGWSQRPQRQLLRAIGGDGQAVGAGGPQAAVTGDRRRRRAQRGQLAAADPDVAERGGHLQLAQPAHGRDRVHGAAAARHRVLAGEVGPGAGDDSREQVTGRGRHAPMLPPGYDTFLRAGPRTGGDPA